MIFFPYSGDTRGGSVHSSFLLIEEILKRNRAAIVAVHGPGYSRDLAAERRLPTIELPPLGVDPELGRKDRLRIGNLSSMKTCYEAIIRNRAGIVHVNDKRMLRTWCLPTRVSRRTLFAHWRSVYAHSWSVAIGLRLASRIICVSNYSQQLLPEWARSKSDVVYNPFEIPLSPEGRLAARRRIREANGIPSDAALVGFFGALLNRKRGHVLLEILQQITRTSDGRPVLGLVCGEPLEPRDQTFYSMIENNDVRYRTKLAGFVTNVPEWMAACDVMIAPAIDEPLARVGVEAQSVGLPAIVSSDGGLSEVIENGVSGIVLHPYDLQAWVANVRRVLEDRQFAVTLSEGGLRAASKLTVSRHADQMEAIYDLRAGERR